MDANKFGYAVQGCRREQCLTQRDLAAISGLSVNAIAMIERGERTPSLLTAMRLAEALGISVDGLLNWELSL